MATIDSSVLKFSLVDSEYSEQGNTGTITRVYYLELAPTYAPTVERGDNGTINHIVDGLILDYREVPQINDILLDPADGTSYVFAPGVNYYVTARSAKPMHKASTSSEVSSVDTWKITIVYTGEGILFGHLSTDFVRVINIESGVTPYNFNVNMAYSSSFTGDDVTDIELQNPSKKIENTANDPFLQGLTQVRNIVFIKITLDYIKRGTFNVEWKSQFSNTLNSKPLFIYGHTVPAYSGRISVDGYRYYSSSTEKFCRHRVTFTIQIKEKYSSEYPGGEPGGWFDEVVNNGFQAYGLTRNGAPLAAGKKDKINMGDISDSTNVKHPESPVSDPVKLDKNGKILTPVDASPIILRFLVQPFMDWTVLALPEGM